METKQQVIDILFLFNPLLHDHSLQVYRKNISINITYTCIKTTLYKTMSFCTGYTFKIVFIKFIGISISLFHSTKIQ